MEDTERIGERLRMFKTGMLLAYPFYGDILLRLPIVPDEHIPTACTDGRTIRWNPAFFAGLGEAQRNYVLMHEVLHVLLRHPARQRNRRKQAWNVAADIIVNRLCDELARDMGKTTSLRMERPPDGIFREVLQDETAENLYGRIQADNQGPEMKTGRGTAMRLRRDYRPSSRRFGDMDIVEVPDRDLYPMLNGEGKPMTDEEAAALETAIGAMIREASTHSRGLGASMKIPRELLEFVRRKPLNWRQLLKEFLSEAQSDETSYATPERKYLHMDLILPGHGMKEEGDMDSIWAFVDSSGSVGTEDLRKFLTELYHIAKEFHCEMNIAYWDTGVTDVYERLRSEKQVITAQPKHSGGTDINCVYLYIQERRLKPAVTLILTDGYFGRPDPGAGKILDPKKTILVLCNNSENPVYRNVGRVCRLQK